MMKSRTKSALSSKPITNNKYSQTSKRRVKPTNHDINWIRFFWNPDKTNPDEAKQKSYGVSQSMVTEIMSVISEKLESFLIQLVLNFEMIKLLL